MFYLDRIHSSTFGARVNAASVAEGIRRYKGLELARYLKPVEKDRVTGSSRKGNHPVLFTIGDSTVKNADKDPNGMWGWGSVLGALFDSHKMTVENCAMAGRSARTFLDEGRWDKVYNALHPGDYVLMQFGHNDAGEINTGKARAELPGISNESKVFLMQPTGKYEVVYTYGWYLRKFIRDAQEKGAIPVVLIYTPRNIWTNGQIERRRDTHALWAQQVAEETGACFIDLNKLSADKLQAEGEEAAKAYFNHDHTHSSLQGARQNAACIVEGIRQVDCGLKKFLK
jgi:lysophospholipase L1-like esterase